MAHSGTDRKRCSGTRKDGEPCRGWAGGESGLCIAHDPDRIGIAQRGRSKAGRVKAALAAAREDAPWAAVTSKQLGDPPSNRTELRILVAKTINWTLTGALDPKRADAVIKLAQRGMALFPEAKEIDPHDQLEDPELHEALVKELRAVEQRLINAGEVVAKGGNGTHEPAVKSAPSEPPVTDWPEVEK